MAEINENDLVSKQALEAPGKLADQLDRVYNSLLKILDAAKKSEKEIISAKSTNKVSKETIKLAETQKRLSQEQQKAAKIAKVLWLSQNEVAESQKRAAQSGKQLGTVVSDLEKKMAGAANSATAYGKAQKESNAQSIQAQKIYKAEAGSIEALTQKRIQLQNAIANQKKNQQEDNDLLRRGVIDRAEFNKRMAESAGVIARNSVGIQALNSQIKNHILTTTQIGGEYKKLTINLESARTKYKDLAASGTASTKMLQDQARVVVDLDKKVKAIDKSVGQFQRNVGNYPQTFNAAAQALGRFLGAFGIVTGITLFARTLMGVIDLITDFEYKNDTLQAVLGETAEGIKELTAQQLRYGESTIYTANQVADLQIIYSKLGLTTKEIENATEATLNLATATGEDLAKSADVVGTILRIFDMNAEETTRVVDVMTGAFNQTTLGLENLFEAMKYVGPIAKANNITYEETAALLGTLADAGIRGSMAGTSLRKIMSELDKGGGTLQDKLKKLAENGFSSADAMDEVGRTAYASLLVLTQNAEQTDKLDKAFHNVTGSAEEAAKVMRDNLKGDVALAAGQLEAMTLDMQNELLPTLRDVVQGFTAFIMMLREVPTFIKENRALIGALVLALIAFRGAQIAATAATLKDIAVKKIQIIWTRAATLTTQGLTASLYAMLGPLGLILLGFAAAAAAVAIYDKNSARANKVARTSAELNKGLAKEIDNVTSAQKNLDVSIENWLKLTEAQKKSVAEQIQFTINHSKVMLARLKIQREQLREQAAELSMWQMIKAAALTTISVSTSATSMAEDSLDNMSEATAEADKQIAKLTEEIEGLNHILDDNYEAEKKSTEQRKENAKEAAKSALELERFRLELQIKTLQEIQDNENNAASLRLAASEQIENLRLALANNFRKRDLLEEGKNAKSKLLVEEQFQAALTEAKKKGMSDRDVIAQYQLNKDIENAEYNAKIVTERMLAERDARIDLEVAAIQKEFLAGQISRERANKLIKEAQIKADKELIELKIQALEQQLANERFIYYQERIKLIEQSNMSAADKEAEIVQIKKESAEEQIEIEKMIHDLTIQLTDDAFNNKKDKFEEEIEALSNVQSYYEDFAGAVAGLFDAITARRMANIDAELRRTEDYYNRQIELAGDNDKAVARIEKQSERRRKELEKKKVDDARRFAKFEKGAAITSSVLKGSLAVLNQLSQGDPYTAQARAIAAGLLAGIEIATIAVQPLPQYAEGVDNHPGGLAVVGDGGGIEKISHAGHTWYSPDHPTVVDLPAGAKVTPHDETMRELATRGLAYGVNHDRQDNSAFNSKVINKLDQLNKTIKDNKPAPVRIVREASTIWEGIQTAEGFTSYFRSLAIRKKK
jgi:hypothetical protein